MAATLRDFPHPSKYLLPPFLMEPDPISQISVLTASRPDLRLSRPLAVGWLMTGRCQLRCQHCWVNRDADESGPKERAAIAHRLAEAGVCRVALSGGEVTLLQDLAQCVAVLKRAGTPISLYTNAVDLNSMRWLEHWDPVLDYVQVSIDGGSRETYEAQRGHGTFRKLLAGLSRLRDNGVRMLAHYVASPWNGCDLQAAATLASHHGCEAFVAEMYLAKGSAASQGRSVAVQVAQKFNTAAEKLLGDEALMSGKMAIHLVLPSIVPFPSWYSTSFREFAPPPLQIRSVFGTTHCFVMPNGVVVPTIEVVGEPAFHGGSLLERDLLSIWRDGPGFSRIQKVRDLRGTLCDGCPDFTHCRGGSLKRTLNLTGRLDMHDPWCHRSSGLLAASALTP